MNKFKIHALINSAKSILEEDSPKTEDIKKIFQIIANELKDPFASSIDEFLEDKNKKENKESDDTEKPVESSDAAHPQDEAIETLKDEAVDYKEPVEQDHPQDEAVETLKDEAIEYKEPVEQDHPQDEAKEKVVDEIKDDDDHDDETQDAVDEKDKELEEARQKQDALQRQIEDLKNKKESQVESSLKQLGYDIAKRGYATIANKFIMASSVGIVDVLNNILMKEFLIRDILENYNYLFDPTTASMAIKLKPKDSILFLQKQIISFGGKPTTQRYVIPAVNPGNSAGILALVREHLSKIKDDYISAVDSIENEEKYFTLKIMLQKIIQAKTNLCCEV